MTAVDEQAWKPVEWDSAGLRGRLAKIIARPVDSGLAPADLPPGTAEVVLVDDTPNVNLDLRAHPVGLPGAIAFIHYDCLALAVQAPHGSARTGHAVPHGDWATPLRDVPPLPPRGLPPLPPVREAQAQQQ